MASFLCGHEVFQISVSSAYGMAEFKADLLGLYAKAGAKGTPVTFLLTDTHIINERFLVYINDLLSTSYIADLCTQVPAAASQLPYCASQPVILQQFSCQCTSLARVWSGPSCLFATCIAGGEG